MDLVGLGSSIESSRVFNSQLKVPWFLCVLNFDGFFAVACAWVFHLVEFSMIFRHFAGETTYCC